MNARQERLMEALLEEEGLTEGLTDVEGQILLNWLMQRTRALFDQNLGPEELEDQAHHLRRQGRIVARIVTALQEGAEPELLRRHLSRLWPDPAQQDSLLSALRNRPPAAARIQYLLAVLEEAS